MLFVVGTTERLPQLLAHPDTRPAPGPDRRSCTETKLNLDRLDDELVERTPPLAPVHGRD